MTAPSRGFAPPGFTNMSLMRMETEWGYRLTLRTACIARHVILRIPVRISTGLYPRGEEGRRTTECDREMQTLIFTSRLLRDSFVFTFKDNFKPTCSLRHFWSHAPWWIVRWGKFCPAMCSIRLLSDVTFPFKNVRLWLINWLVTSQHALKSIVETRSLTRRMTIIFPLV